jgi:GTP-binding protein
MSRLALARFVMGAAELGQLPPDQGWEVAFAGRSNAGKSSAINALTNRRRLAFVSKTPGRTQQINYFALDGDRYLVDLPGYGFAKVPLALQSRWDRLLSGYLQSRASLRGLVVIMDVRHPLTPLDQQLLDWFSPTGKPVLVLLTKADKLTRQQAAAQLRSVSNALNECEVVLFSSVSGLGVEEARRFVERLLSA